MESPAAVYTLEEKTQWIPKAVEGLSIDETGEVATLLHPQTGCIFVINSVAQRVLELSNGQRNVAEIIKVVSQEFEGATEQKITEDIDRFYTKATQKGLIAWNQ